MGIEYFMVISAVKVLYKSVLLGFAVLDKLELNTFFFVPVDEDGRTEFPTVIKADGFWQIHHLS